MTLVLKKSQNQIKGVIKAVGQWMYLLEETNNCNLIKSFVKVIFNIKMDIRVIYNNDLI